MRVLYHYKQNNISNTINNCELMVFINLFDDNLIKLSVKYN